jgi:hypothetical protein
VFRKPRNRNTRDRQHPSGVGQLHTGCCPKGGPAVPVLTATLARKRSLRVARRRHFNPKVSDIGLLTPPIPRRQGVRHFLTHPKGALAPSGTCSMSDTYHYSLLPTTYSLLTFRRGARLSLNGGRHTDALVVRPPVSSPLRGLPPPPNTPDTTSLTP